MSVESFIDSNVFVYLFDETDDRKREIAANIVDGARRFGRACISFQVVQETLNVVTRKLPEPMTGEAAVSFMERVLEPLWTVMPSAALYRRATEVQSRYGYGFYDSLVISSALAAGCRKLYTEDLQDGQKIGRLTIRNPFAE